MAPRKDREYAVMKQDPFEPRIWHDHGIEIATKPEEARVIARSRVSDEERPGIWVAIPTTNFQPSAFREKIIREHFEDAVDLPAPHPKVHLDADGNVPIPGQTDLPGAGVPVTGEPAHEAAAAGEKTAGRAKVKDAAPEAAETPPEPTAEAPVYPDVPLPQADGVPIPEEEVAVEPDPVTIVPDVAAATPASAPPAAAPVADEPPAETPAVQQAEQGPPAEAPEVTRVPEPAAPHDSSAVAEKLAAGEKARKAKEIADRKAAHEAALAKAAAANGGVLPPGPDGFGGGEPVGEGAPAAAAPGDGFGIPTGF